MFTTDSRTEKYLTSMGVKWKYVTDMTYAKLASDWETKNVGRSQVKVDKAVAEYGVLMGRGSEAPAPILWYNAALRGHDVLDGIQRLLAAKKLVKDNFAAYVIEGAAPSLARTIRVFANYRLQGGYQETADWTMEQAIRLLLIEGTATVEEVANAGGWTAAAIRDKKQVMDCGDIINNIGGPTKLPDAMLRIVNKHSQPMDFDMAPKPIAEFFLDVKKLKLPTAEAEKHIEQFFTIPRRKGKLHEVFSSKLEEFRTDEEIVPRLADPSRRRPAPLTGETKLLKALKGVLTTAESVRDNGDKIPQMAEYFHMCGQLHKVLKQIETFSKKKK